jgi:hypothetical protein
MKTSIRPAMSFLTVLAATSILPNFGNPAPQGPPEIEMNEGVFFVRWEGVPDRTYFVRTSSDMQDWDFIPEIEHGEGDFHYGFESTGDRFFVDVVAVDQPLLANGQPTTPEEADFDGDGLPSFYELLNGLNPLDRETVDGIADGSGDREMDGRIDHTETGGSPASHPSRVDNPKVKLSVEVMQ